MRAYVSEVVDSRNFEPLAVPLILSKELPGFLITGKAKAFFVSNLGAYALEVRFAALHGSDVTGLVRGAGGYNHEIIS